MAKVGFNGQWVEIARVGKFRDSQGVDRYLSNDFLGQVAANYNAGNHEAAIVIGHPELDTAPAFGWTAELRMSGNVLQARFSDTNDEFESMVETGAYKKRSSSLYLDPPNLRHVAFLGAQPPAIKGLRDIKFADGESFTFETFINLQETNMGLEDGDVEKVTEGVWAKLQGWLKKGGDSQPAATSLSEDAVKQMIVDSAKQLAATMTADFKEKTELLSAEMEKLQKQADGHSATARHAEAASFMESYPATKGKFWLKRRGIVEFLERLINDDESDKNASAAISFSEGDGADKTEKKFSRFDFAKDLLNALEPTIELGEKYGQIVASPAAEATMVDPARIAKLREGMGLPATPAAAGGDK